MAKRKSDAAETKDVKTCKICGDVSPLDVEMCPKCGAFLPDEVGIQALIEQMGKKYESIGTRIYRITDSPFYSSPYPPISTGSLRLDRGLLGGIPERSRVEIAGDSAAGKSSLCLHISATVTRAGGYVLYIDKENSVDLPYALRIGVVPERMLIVNPTSGTEAVDYMLNFAPKVQLVVLDSVAACRSAGSTTKEVKVKGDGEVKDNANIGDLARLMSELEAKLEAVVPKTRCTYLLVNQLRYKMNGPGIPPSIVSMGGQAMTYMPTMKLWLRGAKDIENEDGLIVGKTTQVTIKKAKHIGVKSTVSLTLGYCGIDVMKEVIDMGVEYGVAEKSGNWFYYTADDGTVIKANGEGQYRAALEAYHHIYTELHNKIKQAQAEEFERARQETSAAIDAAIEQERDLSPEEIAEFIQGAEDGTIETVESGDSAADR